MRGETVSAGTKVWGKSAQSLVAPCSDDHQLSKDDFETLEKLDEVCVQIVLIKIWPDSSDT